MKVAIIRSRLSKVIVLGHLLFVDENKQQIRKLHKHQ